MISKGRVRPFVFCFNGWLAQKMKQPIPIPTMREQLLAWFDEHHRKLPWRRHSDPYRIWVSEIMLQQTRVATVLDYYPKFLKKFPNIKKLAAAKESEVLAAWSGLGYYRRARNMRFAAKVIESEH